MSSRIRGFAVALGGSSHHFVGVDTPLRGVKVELEVCQHLSRRRQVDVVVVAGWEAGVTDDQQRATGRFGAVDGAVELLALLGAHGEKVHLHE